MLLTNPYTGLAVDAPEGVAERLMAQGFKPAKAAPKRRAPKKTAPKKNE